MSMFHVGQMVKCVNARPVRPFNFPNGISEGLIYHIRGFGKCGDGAAGVYLVEVNRQSSLWDGIEPPFYAWRFRPVKDTSIEIFRSLLSPVPEEVA